MTGPEHYREAERLLAIAAASTDAPGITAQVTAEAQVHATLALSAAQDGPQYAAAELRRFAHGLDPSTTGIYRQIHDQLLARADELAPS